MHFDFVAEGDYILRASGSDVRRIEVLNPPGSMPPSNWTETPLHPYGETDQPLSVRGDMAGFTVPLPEKGQAPAAAAAAKASQ